MCVVFLFSVLGPTVQSLTLNVFVERGWQQPNDTQNSSTFKGYSSYMIISNAFAKVNENMGDGIGKVWRVIYTHVDFYVLLSHRQYAWSLEQACTPKPSRKAPI